MHSFWIFLAAVAVIALLGIITLRNEVSNLLRASKEDEEKNGKTWGPHPD